MSQKTTTACSMIEQPNGIGMVALGRVAAFVELRWVRI